MQDNSQNPGNVVSLFKARKAVEETPANNEKPSSAPADSFAETMRRNEEAKKRMEIERAKANRSVLKSYKIKQ